jgi:hypothetical protein
MSANFHFLICQDFSREVKAISEHAEFSDVTFSYFPADCERMRTDFRDVKLEVLKDGDDLPVPVSVIGGHCSACLRRVSPINDRYTILPVDDCFELIIGGSSIHRYLAEGAHLLNPGMLRRWRKSKDVWGKNANHVRSMFADSASRFVLIDTGTDRRSSELLEELSSIVGMPYETVPVGIDHFELKLSNLIGVIARFVR